MPKKRPKPAPPPPTPIAPVANPGRQVIEWMIAGQREADIEEAVATQFPRQSAKKLIEAAVDHFQEAAHCERNVILGWSMEAYRALYRKLLEIGDYHGAMKAVASLQKLASELPPEDEDDETEDDIKT
jgi:hypothetical protein